MSTDIFLPLNSLFRHFDALVRLASIRLYQAHDFRASRPVRTSPRARLPPLCAISARRTTRPSRDGPLIPRNYPRSLSCAHRPLRLRPCPPRSHIPKGDGNLETFPTDSNPRETRVSVLGR